LTIQSPSQFLVSGFTLTTRRHARCSLLLLCAAASVRQVSAAINKMKDDHKQAGQQASKKEGRHIDVRSLVRKASVTLIGGLVPRISASLTVFCLVSVCCSFKKSHQPFFWDKLLTHIGTLLVFECCAAAK
jgi:hypothetical protein